MELINKHKDALKKLCDKFQVAEMYVFGSAVKDNLRGNSDIDFPVRFSGVNPIDYFDNYMDFKTALSKLFSRNIDLVEIQTIKNPILRKSIDRNKIILYGREDSKVAL